MTDLSPVQIPDLSHLLQARLRKLEVVKIPSEKFRHEISTLTVDPASATIVPSPEFEFLTLTGEFLRACVGEDAAWLTFFTNHACLLFFVACCVVMLGWVALPQKIPLDNAQLAWLRLVTELKCTSCISGAVFVVPHSSVVAGR